MLTQSNKETKGKVVKLTPLFLGMLSFFTSSLGTPLILAKLIDDHSIANKIIENNTSSCAMSDKS